MKKIFVFVFAVIIFIGFIITTVVVNNNANLTASEKYLKKFDFQTVQLGDTMELLSEDLSPITWTPQMRKLLGFGNLNQDNLNGKLITTEVYEAFEHPLEAMYEELYGPKSEDYHVYLTLFIVDDKVIGSYTYHLDKNYIDRFSELYNIKGQSLKEVTGMTYAEIMEAHQIKL